MGLGLTDTKVSLLIVIVSSLIARPFGTIKVSRRGLDMFSLFTFDSSNASFLELIKVSLRMSFAGDPDEAIRKG